MERREKGSEWGNLMNIPSGSERDYLQASRQTTAQRNNFKSCRNPRGSAARLNLPLGQCMKGLGSRPACMRVCYCQCASFHAEATASPPIINLADKRQYKPESATVWQERN